MLQVIYYLIISVMSLFVLFNLIRKREWFELICIAVVLVTFVLRALHIK